MSVCVTFSDNFFTFSYGLINCSHDMTLSLPEPMQLVLYDVIMMNDDVIIVHT